MTGYGIGDRGGVLGWIDNEPVEVTGEKFVPEWAAVDFGEDAWAMTADDMRAAWDRRVKA
jgi:hypothetical protein